MRQNKFVTKVLSIAMAGTMALAMPTQVFAANQTFTGDGNTAIPFSMTIESSYTVELPATLTNDNVKHFNGSDYYLNNDDEQFGTILGVQFDVSVDTSGVTRDQAVVMSFDGDIITNGDVELLPTAETGALVISQMPMGDKHLVPNPGYATLDNPGYYLQYVQDGNGVIWPEDIVSSFSVYGSHSNVPRSVILDQDFVAGVGFRVVDKDIDAKRWAEARDFMHGTYSGNLTARWSLETLDDGSLLLEGY